MALTGKELQSKLSLVPDILRGRVNSADLVSYTSSILALKLLSDRFEEEVENAVARGAAREVALADRDQHEFFLPERTRWSKLTRPPRVNLGEALDEACQAIEEANAPKLDGVLSRAKWSDKSRVIDPDDRERVNRDLVNYFSRVVLRDGSPANNGGSLGSILGEVYDEFRANELPTDLQEMEVLTSTPMNVARLVVELLHPTEGMWICDPMAGTGRMLTMVAKFVHEQGGDPRKLVLHGQEIHSGILSDARLNLLLHGLSLARLEEGDVIQSPKLLDDQRRLISYDRVIGNPPFGSHDWGRDFAPFDRHHRFDRYGDIPHRSRGEFAYLLHMLEVTDPRGMVGVVMPHSTLFRGGADATIRRGLVNDDLFEAVIDLGPYQLPHSGVKGALWVLNRVKLAKRRGKVLFIDATQKGPIGSGEAQTILASEHMDRIVDAYRAFRDVEGLACVVDTRRIEDNDFNLDISRYLYSMEPPTVFSVQTKLAELREAERRRDEAERKMDTLVAELSNDGQTPPISPAHIGETLQRLENLYRNQAVHLEAGVRALRNVIDNVENSRDSLLEFRRDVVEGGIRKWGALQNRSTPGVSRIRRSFVVLLSALNEGFAQASQAVEDSSSPAHDLEPVEWLESVCGNTAYQMGLGAEALTKVIECFENDPGSISEALQGLRDAVGELQREKKSVRNRNARERSLIRERIHGDLLMFLSAYQEELERVCEELE